MKVNIIQLYGMIKTRSQTFIAFVNTNISSIEYGL